MKSRNKEVRKGIAQTQEEAGKTYIKLLKRYNKVFTKWKLVLLKITFMTYLKLRPSQNKILLLSRGVKRNFGSKIETKISSAIRKKLNLGSEISKNSKINLNLSVLRRSKQHVTRNRNSIITIGDRTCFNTIEKSRNLRLDSRISKICRQRSISRTPALQKYNPVIANCPKRK